MVWADLNFPGFQMSNFLPDILRIQISVASIAFARELIVISHMNRRNWKPTPPCSLNRSLFPLRLSLGSSQCWLMRNSVRAAVMARKENRVAPIRCSISDMITSSKDQSGCFRKTARMSGRFRFVLPIESVLPNETKISHGRALWQSRWIYLAMERLASSHG